MEQTVSDVPAGNEWLTSSERQTLARIRMSRRITEWRLGRWTAKCAVAAYLQVSRSAEIEVYAAASGAPRVSLDGADVASISLSHSGGRALCTVAPAGTAMGCDLEMVEPRAPSFALNYLTPEEQSWFNSSGESRWGVLTLIWSAKESVLKALELGLRADTRSVCVRQTSRFLNDSDWLPLTAETVNGVLFSGRWRQIRGFVRTVLANQPVGRLCPLRPFAVT